MNVGEAIDRLNKITSNSPERLTPFKTTEELRRFFRNPRKQGPGPPAELIGPIVEAFKTAKDAGRQRIVSKLSPHAQGAFLGYAADMAVLAVRRGSRELVVSGLTALAIEGGRFDIRDSIVALAKLYHSALKLGMDAAGAFRDVAALANPGQMRIEMGRFPARPPGARDLEAFCLREVLTDDGFNYEQVIP